MAPPGTGEHPEPLTLEQVASVLADNLAILGVAAPAPNFPLDDETWIDLVHHTYYPSITVE